MLDLTHSVIVIPTRPGQVALAQRQPGTRMAGQYVTPGGSINVPGNEDDEEVDATIPDAAARELEEETGLEVEAERLKYLGKFTATGEDWQPIGGHYFLLRVESGEELVTPESEADKQGPWRWYSFREAAALPLPPVTRGLIHLLAHEAAGG